ncbi:hypothetical protein PGTUg99_004728 [Puccinia graminis f. sp. tritici]|uniref:Uncharacterized protein n=1 Tax=Puccinia graminis f. sp. tritici TaxID=56615 RepID=A0A5B0PT95_PUCGR|nr:hypothetical protein PGTUg99_004728 [Puccinia graminis f. sp. tritici]
MRVLDREVDTRTFSEVREYILYLRAGHAFHDLTNPARKRAYIVFGRELEKLREHVAREDVAGAKCSGANFDQVRKDCAKPSVV